MVVLSPGTNNSGPHRTAPISSPPPLFHASQPPHPTQKTFGFDIAPTKKNTDVSIVLKVIIPSGKRKEKKRKNKHLLRGLRLSPGSTHQWKKKKEMTKIRTEHIYTQTQAPPPPLSAASAYDWDMHMHKVHTVCTHDVYHLNI